jgi:hypothetical protein
MFVTLSILDLDIEEIGNCHYDYLSIYDAGLRAFQIEMKTCD